MIRRIVLRFFNNRKNIASLFSALMFLSTIFVFGPIVIYQGNIDGFGVPLLSILFFLLIPFCLALVLLTFVGVILTDRIHQRFVAILSCLSILLWVQGTFIVWDLGVLDGTSIDWTKDKWKGLVDSLIWIILLGCAIIGYRRFYRFAMYAIIFILFSQLAIVVVITFQKPEIWTQKFPLEFSTPKEVFQFSSEQNVLHIVLDQFGTPLFEDVIKDNKAYLNDLDGFTFFKEVTTSSHVTLLSVPSFLSGQIYANEIPIQEFYQLYYQKNNIHTALFQHGYELDVINQPRFLKKREIDSYYYNIPTPYNNTTTEQVCINEAAFLVDLVLFRFVPYYLKTLIYNNQSWLFSSISLPEKHSRFEHFSANEFLHDIAVHASIYRKKPVYKYIHLMTPHPPLVVGVNNNFSGKVLPATPGNFKLQAEYTFENVLKVLESLKYLDLYNSSLIIIQSDHGSGIPFDIESPDGSIVKSYKTFLPSDAFLPLLLIKPPHHKGPLRTSIAQGDLSDLPATISSILKIQKHFPGQSLFDIDPLEDRKRTTYYSFTTHRNDAMVSGFFEELQEYEISGSAYKINSWKKGRILKKFLQPYIWGTTLQFHKQGNILPYLQQGWSLPEDHHIWNNGKNASFKLPITQPKNDMIELECHISPFLFPSKNLDKQQVVISINNTQVGEFLLTESGNQMQSLLFPESLLANSPYMLVNFYFPNATIGSEIGLKDNRMLSLAFTTIIFIEHSD